MWLVLSFLILIWVRMLPTFPPRPTPTAPPVPRKRTKADGASPRRRPHWIAEIKTGRTSPPLTVKLYARTEGDALMKLLTPPYYYEPRDVLSLTFYE